MASTPDRTEFQQAIARRSDRWFAACLAITRSHDLAEDAVQDALLAAWNKRDQFKHGSSLDTWIHRIAVNAALALLRKQKPGVFSEYVDDIETSDASPDAVRADEEPFSHWRSCPTRAPRHCLGFSRISDCPETPASRRSSGWSSPIRRTPGSTLTSS